MRVSVRDDGHGGADLAQGTGLIGVRDRVEALGGLLYLDKPARRRDHAAGGFPAGCYQAGQTLSRLGPGVPGNGV